MKRCRVDARRQDRILGEANRAKLAITVPTTMTVSHSNGPECAQHNQIGSKRINK